MVWGLGFRDFRVWGLGFGVWGLGFRVFEDFGQAEQYSYDQMTISYTISVHNVEFFSLEGFRV